MSPAMDPRTLLALALLLAPAGAPALTQEKYDRVRAEVLPSAEESAWLKIPWRASLWAAAVEAQEKDRPILLWAMNGHPLACT